jgi:hypothetical protein
MCSNRNKKDFKIEKNIKKISWGQKEELCKLKYFTMKKYNLQKNPLKETKIIQDIITR